MQAASARFLTALTSGAYRLATQVSIPATGVTVPVSAGQITVDRTAAQRRRATLIVEALPGTPAAALIPTSSSAPLAPFGNEIQVQSGIVYPDGSRELISLGVFPIATSTVTDTGTDLQISLDCYDRSWTVSIRKFKTPYAVAAGTDVAAAIRGLIGSVYPGLTYNIVPTPGASTTPAATFAEGADPWAAALTLAASVGLELFFDVNGVVVGRPIPPAGATVWTFTEGTTTGPVQVRNVYTRDQVSNDFIVSGDGTPNAATGPVRAEASDTNPNSPTYTGGPFGDVPTFITSNLVTSTTDAANAAANALAASVGGAHLLTVSCPPNPLFDVDDVVAVTRTRAGLAGQRFVVDQIKHTIRHDDLTTLTGRAVT